MRCDVHHCTFRRSSLSGNLRAPGAVVLEPSPIGFSACPVRPRCRVLVRQVSKCFDAEARNLACVGGDVALARPVRDSRWQHQVHGSTALGAGGHWLRRDMAWSMCRQNARARRDSQARRMLHLQISPRWVPARVVMPRVRHARQGVMLGIDHRPVRARRSAVRHRTRPGHHPDLSRVFHEVPSSDLSNEQPHTHRARLGRDRDLVGGFAVRAATGHRGSWRESTEASGSEFDKASCANVGGACVHRDFRRHCGLVVIARRHPSRSTFSIARSSTPRSACDVLGNSQRVILERSSIGSAARGQSLSTTPTGRLHGGQLTWTRHQTGLIAAPSPRVGSR